MKEITYKVLLTNIYICEWYWRIKKPMVMNNAMEHAKS